jgi:hypothetical protein
VSLAGRVAGIRVTAGTREREGLLSDGDAESSFGEGLGTNRRRRQTDNKKLNIVQSSSHDSLPRRSAKLFSADYAQVCALARLK